MTGPAERSPNTEPGEGATPDDDRVDAALARTQPPTLGLLGKTGADKSSIVRVLTGSEAAEVGDGFRPCTRTAQQFDFPDPAAPVLRFLDTRGLGEPGYDARADLAAFAAATHLVLLTVRVADQSLAAVVDAMQQVRQSAPERPSLLVLTCLHELHRETESIRIALRPDGRGLLVERPHDDASSDASADTSADTSPNASAADASLQQAIDGQCERFAGLFDAVVAIDFTPIEWAMPVANLGEQQLRDAILDWLPQAQRQAGRLALTAAGNGVEQARLIGYATAAATAAAVPLPWVDIPVVAGLQWRLSTEVARHHGQSMDRTALGRMSGLIGTRAAIGMAIRGFLKGVPLLGSAINATTAFASTYAAGAAADFYFAARTADQSPNAAAIRRVYEEQLQYAMQLWRRTQDDRTPE